MKRNLALILALLFASTAQAILWIVPTRPAAGGGITISDDFNRANSTSLGANWTEVKNDLKIDTNALTNDTANAWTAAVHNTSLSTITQYGKIKVSDNGGSTGATALVFRYTDASSAFYTVMLNRFDGTFSWRHNDNITAYTETIIESAAVTFANGDTFGVVVTGTGASTEIRIWLNPTGASPTSSSLWGGAGPTNTFVNNPASAVDTGNKVGLSFYALIAAGNLNDDFSAGDVP